MYLYIRRALEQIFEGKVCRIVIFPVVLCGFETWSLTLGDEHRLRVFENRVLRRVFEPKRDEVVREWRRLHNEELHGLFFFFHGPTAPSGAGPPRYGGFTNTLRHKTVGRTPLDE